MCDLEYDHESEKESFELFWVDFVEDCGSSLAAVKELTIFSIPTNDELQAFLDLS